MHLDLLAIAAHPDDVELTCGGTLLKMAERGYRTGILDLTEGEMGSRGTLETRRREAAAAARILRVSVRENAGLPDARLALNEESKLAVAQKIRALRPRCVILPYWEARHPDHYAASHIGYEGCFLAGLKKLALEGKPHRPAKILYSTAYAQIRPTFVVDISKQFDRRRRAILAYRTQFRPSAAERHRTARAGVHLGIDRLDEEVALLARYFGQMAGVAYAEPFYVREIMEVDDVVRMAGRSI